MELDRSNNFQMFFKIGVLENFAVFTGKKHELEVFSGEYCEIFKNSFFYRTPLVAASS